MNKKLKISLIIGIPAVVLIAAALILFLPGGVLNKSDTASPEQAPAITLAQYNQVTEGMPYEQAVEILGSPGTVRSEAGEKGTAAHVVSYVWYGESTEDFAAMTFFGGKLASKTYIGLK